MEFIQNFMEDEQSGMVEEESVEEIKKRVNAMLKEIEDRKRSRHNMSIKISVITSCIHGFYWM